MIRTQIQLTAEQADRVKRIARERGVSMATVIREAIDLLDQHRAERDRRDTWGRFRSVVGAFQGGTGRVSETHDDELERAYEDWRR